VNRARLPIASQLIRDADDELGQSIARRLSKKLDMMVYVSCNLPAASEMVPLVAALEKGVCSLLRESNVPN
jgi:hypothetical protein